MTSLTSAVVFKQHENFADRDILIYFNFFRDILIFSRDILIFSGIF